MVEPIIKTEHLYKRFGALSVADDVSIDLQPNEIHAVIGPNGAGKTSLISIICGLLTPDSGQVFFEGADITAEKPTSRVRLGIARTTQLTSLFPTATVLENLILAHEAAAGRSARYFGRVADAALDESLAMLHELGLNHRIETKASALSHGEQRRLELAMALVTKPIVLILDEPMAGTSPDETQGLTKLLLSLKRRYAILLIEHDMQ